MSECFLAAQGPGAVEAMDTATTQVLLALRRSLAAESSSLSLEGNPPPVLDF